MKYLFLCLLLAGCGSGAVSAPPVAVIPTPLVVTPATVTAYSDLPTTILISGGTPPYSFFTSDQSVIGIAPVAGNLVAFFPNQVAADTPVTLTIRDSGGMSASVAVTVRPSIISNDVTVTPVQSSCAPAVCSGGEALITATLTRGGAFLVGRAVKVEAVSGNFSLIQANGNLAQAIEVLSDDSGRIHARIRVFQTATNGTGIVQITDLVSLAFRRASFTIAQADAASSGFFVVPDSVTFKGPRVNECASAGVSAGVFVFGGLPPYTVSNTSSAFSISSNVLAQSGDSFSVSPNGTCVDAPGAPIVVRDTAGRTATTRIANVPGTATNPALAAAPTDVNVSCSSAASIVVTGGTGSYFATPSNSSIVATPNGQGFTLTRRKASPDPTVPVVISDSVSSVTVTAHVTDFSLNCP